VYEYTTNLSNLLRNFHGSSAAVERGKDAKNGDFLKNGHFRGHF
tara:strand:- start:195 stop:326 length:132 start_codon:yes stop_codon:yes gene_type:complete